MSQRSPFNDRYKVESKGKTRKSASAAKPKRAVADVGTQAKRKTGRSSAWSRAKAASAAKQRSSGKQAPPELVPTERYKKLSRYMWTGWAVSLVGALGVVGLQSLKGQWLAYIPLGWIIYFAGIGVAFYTQFVPMRREREVMIQASRSGRGKADKQ